MKRVLVPRCAPGLARLDHDEAHYVRDVLRLAPGDTVEVFDADSEAPAVLRAVSRHGVEIEIGEPAPAPPPRTAVVLLGMPRPALVEEAVTLGTEAGASEFWLFPAERSLPAPARLDRLERVALAAARQCRRPRPVSLLALTGLDGALARAAALGVPRVFGDLDATTPPPSAPAGLVLAVGPEGGWTARERAMLLAEGWMGARLGDHVLRAPTAVVAGLLLTRRCW
ncbi:MAG: 16S rRNA (uracil(1498)-N(3))-methyltransferase [Deltaproteobacteria bacterium]|nr:16S rRNA (uracil(1498)-N(3))-methyltransferase [Deltaproteobacteria bacterium]